MRAAAELGRKLAHAYHADEVPVFVAEEGERAAADRLVERQLLARHRRVLPDVRIDLVLDLDQPLALDRALEREIEAHALGSDHRSRLTHLRSQPLAQHGVQDVGDRVIEPGAVIKECILSNYTRVTSVARLDRALVFGPNCIDPSGNYIDVEEARLQWVVDDARNKQDFSDEELELRQFAASVERS